MFSKLFFSLVFLLLANGLRAQSVPLDTVGTIVHADIPDNGFTCLRHGEEPHTGADLYIQDQNDTPHFLKNVLFNASTHFSNIELIDHLQKNFYSNSDTWPDRKNTIRFVLIPEDLPLR